MNPFDIYKNQLEYLNIKLKSDAFEGGEPFFYKEKPEDYYQEISEVHKVLYHLKKNKPLSINIYYEPIKEDFLDDIVELNKEWFPFEYDRDFFKKYLVKKNSVAIGAFLKIGIKVYLIGYALGDIIPEQKFKNILPGVLVERSWYDIFSSWVECGNLHTLGVIDEYRKLSVGTRLLELFTEEMKKRNVVVLYLNIIIHNNAAIKFIEANNWHFFGKEKNYYKYRDNLYDSKVYYYILDKNWCNVKDAPKEDKGVNKNGIEEISSVQRGCWDSLFGSYYSNNSNANNNKKNIDNSSPEIINKDYNV
jgi:ribosomal protein S18 acetylase RimI-like enzyme